MNADDLNLDKYASLTKSPDRLNAMFSNLATDQSYVNELQAAIRDFHDPLSASEILLLAQLYTAEQVVKTRVDAYTFDDLKILVWLNRKDTALTKARSRSHRDECLGALLAIYDVLVAQGEPDTELLSEAEGIAANDTTALLRIALEWANLGRVERVEDILQGSPDHTATSTNQIILAIAFAKTGDKENALKTIASIDTKHLRLQIHARLEVARKLIAVKTLDNASDLVLEANELSEQLTDVFERVEAQSLVALLMGDVGLSNEAHTLLTAIIAAIRNLDDPLARARRLRTVGETLGSLGWIDEANNILDEARAAARKDFNFPYNYASIVTRIAVTSAQFGQLERAQALMEGFPLETDRARNEPLCFIVHRLAVEGRTEEALRYTSKETYVFTGGEIDRSDTPKPKRRADPYKNENSELKADMLRSIALGLAEAGKLDQANQVFLEAQKTAARKYGTARIGDYETKIAKLKAKDPPTQDDWKKQIDELVSAGEIAEALAISENLTTYNDQTEALRLVAKAMTQVNQADKALEIAKERLHGLSQIGVFTTIAYQLTQMGQVNISSLILSEAHQLAINQYSEMSKIYALGMVAETLADCGDLSTADEVFNEADEIIQTLANHQARIHMLGVNLASRTRSKRISNHEELLIEARKIAELNKDAIGRRAGALFSVALYLSTLGMTDEARLIVAEAKQHMHEFTTLEEFGDLQLRLAVNHAHLGEFAQAFNLIASARRAGQESLWTSDALDVFLSRLTTDGLLSAVDKVQAGLATDMIREALRIASWLRPNPE